ncbi:hypothetical protein ACFQE8_06430 [Salinirubellus sp. GCM10025818]|jgi:hypothetical protein|uniref:DUF7562 family protein n=1 Tax=Salinirubellus TaxID=2162630 RepID=UPI0030D02641
MLGRRDRRGHREVTCVACGLDLPRSDAREYDKFGDRYDRRDKEFEYLCKPCYRGLCHQPRRGLEDLLVASGAGEQSRDGFLAEFAALLDEGASAETDPPTERDERNER